ncbi:hypothetical protein NUACC21_14410 [Scytonema sp. NUACC21]
MHLQFGLLHDLENCYSSIEAIGMLIRSLKNLVLGLAILPFVWQPASAHVVWFNYENGEYKLLYGHPEEGPQSYRVSGFREANAYDANRQIIPVTISQNEDGISLTANSRVAALTGFYDNGFYARVPGNNYLRISESEIEQYENVSHNLKYTKALYDWSKALGQPFNQQLEIVPLQNPFLVKEGDNLPVQVFYQGNPISDGLLVEHLGQEVPKGNDGVFNIPIGVEGLQAIEASYDTVLSGTNVTLSYAASFTAQKIFEPSALLGLGVVSLLAIRKKRI